MTLQTYFLGMSMLLLNFIFLTGKRMTGHLEQTSEKSRTMRGEERGKTKMSFKDKTCPWKYHQWLKPPESLP